MSKDIELVGLWSTVLVIVPAWNEEVVVGTVIDDIHRSIPGVDVLVVSDGSTDRTAEVAKSRGARVLDLPLNLGVGGAMRAGYLFAKRHGYQWAVQLDADGQHNPEDVPSLLRKAASEDADVVIGARFAGKGDYSVRGPRKWAMNLLSLVLSRVTGTHLTDTTSGFKIASRRAIELYSREYPAEYLGDTVETLVISARSGLVVRQIPVAMRPRAGGDPSHNPWQAAIFLVRAVFALMIALTGRSRMRQGGGAR